ncbi:MAG: ribosomal protein S18-alanine N-acetyltransferase [Lachnospiraceae bacterium]|nr:ribosomal protein S18-alanine N-acetyltransferase [Lachnospiraceae bacterium]
MIRRAEVSDILAIAEISETNFRDGWNADDIAGTIDQTQARVIVYEDAGEILGYVIFYFAADEGEIPSIAVRTEARRRGIGSALLAALFEEARALRVRKIFLEVREHNAPAQALYRKNGFLYVGERRKFYSEPAEDAHILLCTVGGSAGS